MVKTEEELLSGVLAQILLIEPDVILAHDLYGVAMETIINRAAKLKIRELNRLGRLNRIKQMDQIRNNEKKSRYLTAGRLLCDLYNSAREYLTGQQDYSLSSLSKSVLKETLVELGQEELVNLV